MIPGNILPPTYITVKCTLMEEALGLQSANKELVIDHIREQAPDAKTAEEEIAVLGVDDYIVKQMTVFPKDAQGRPFWWDYQIRGAFKDWCKAMVDIPGSLAQALGPWRYGNVISTLIMVYPRQIPIILPPGAKPRVVIDKEPKDKEDKEKAGNGMPEETCQRPLRVVTIRGERVALSISETVPVGSTFEFEVELMTPFVAGKVIEETEEEKAAAKEAAEVAEKDGKKKDGKKVGAKRRNKILLRPLLDELFWYSSTRRGWGQWRNSGKGIYSYEIVDAGLIHTNPPPKA